MKTIATLFMALSLTACQQAATAETKQDNQFESQQETFKAPKKVQTAVTNTIDIKVFYLDRSLLPPGAELKVILEDVSKTDTKSEIVASRTFVLETAPPYNVSLLVDKTKIKPSRQYSVRANIRKNGELLYTSTMRHDPFATQTPIQIKLSKVERRASTEHKVPNAQFLNTYWKAIQLNGQVIELNSGDRELFIQMKAGNKLRGFAGCNNFHGGFSASQSVLSFDKLASTMMACNAITGERENKMHHVLKSTHSYKIAGDTLKLYNVAGEKIGVFNAVYF